ncbi:MAG: hypothetical protein ACXWZ2_19145, partial [Mycobacterium sp.]
DRRDDCESGRDASATRCHGAPDARRSQGASELSSAHTRNSAGDAVRDPPGVASRCLEGGASPYVHSTVLGMSWL